MGSMVRGSGLTENPPAIPARHDYIGTGGRRAGLNRPTSKVNERMITLNGEL